MCAILTAELTINMSCGVWNIYKPKAMTTACKSARINGV